MSKTCENCFWSHSAKIIVYRQKEPTACDAFECKRFPEWKKFLAHVPHYCGEWKPKDPTQ